MNDGRPTYNSKLLRGRSQRAVVGVASGRSERAEGVVHNLPPKKSGMKRLQELQDIKQLQGHCPFHHHWLHIISNPA